MSIKNECEWFCTSEDCYMNGCANTREEEKACDRNDVPTNRFGCSYIYCDCETPCYEKNDTPTTIVLNGPVTINGDIIINKGNK